jgi:hypothetical protein
MTISSTYTPAQFSGNDVAVAFAFTFKTFDQADLVVVLTSSAGTEATQTITTEYTVALNADQNNNPGGTVTMLTAPATGETLTIARELDALQETDIANGGGFYPEVLEDALDRLTMLSQQNSDILARSLRSSVAGGSVGDLPTVADRASKYLAFDANGDPVATSSTGTGPVISTFAETLLDDTTAAAARATLGVAIGTNVQAYNATLAAIAAQAEAANKIQYYTADNTPALLDFKDEDNMASDSPTAVPSQQSVKAYADTKTTLAATAAADWAPKAWIRFNGTGTPAIVSSYNVASITDNGTGDYTINFTTPFANTNYCLIGTADSQIGSTNATRSVEIHTLSVGSARIQTVNSAGGLEDVEHAVIMIFGSQ